MLKIKRVITWKGDNPGWNSCCRK